MSTNKKEQFINQYLKGRKIHELSDKETKSVLTKIKNHFIFYKNITEEPQITKDNLRYKEASRNMKALRDLKNEIVEIHS